MSSKRSSTRSQHPAQRRPRAGKACTFCRIAKHRCEPVSYGVCDAACRRCVSQELECSIAARSQSPGSGFSAQDSGPIRHHIAPRSSSGPTEEEMMPSSETNVQHTLQQPEWSRLLEQHGASTTIHALGQTHIGTPGFSPLAPTMEGDQQNFPYDAQGHSHLESSYYPGDFYAPAIPYMTLYATQSASDGEPNLGYVVEDARPGNDGASSSKQHAK